MSSIRPGSGNATPFLSFAWLPEGRGALFLFRASDPGIVSFWTQLHHKCDSFDRIIVLVTSHQENSSTTVRCTYTWKCRPSPLWNSCKPYTTAQGTQQTIHLFHSRIGNAHQKLQKNCENLHSERHGTFLQNVCRPRRIQPPPPHPGGQPHLAQTQVTADFFKFLTFGTEPPGTLHTFTMPGKRKYLEKEKQLPYNCLHCKHRTVVFLLHAPCCISHRCFSCVPAPRPFGSHQVWQNLSRLPSMCPKRINLHWVYK